MSRNWNELTIWKESHKLVLDIYRITAKFSKEEQYGLISQIRRAVVSIPTNIVEGHSKGSTKDFIRFLYISRGSLEEIKYLLQLSKDLDYIDNNIFEKFFQRLSKLSLQLNSFIKYSQ
ncbi:four helix bundle protein [Deferribacter abyssi]|uniref:four helix bundle protein n=1 Tax=Deferribacter abyssi TaxID=213806 RepID=UPI003C19AE89